MPLRSWARRRSAPPPRRLRRFRRWLARAMAGAAGASIPDAFGGPTRRAMSWPSLIMPRRRSIFSRRGGAGLQAPGVRVDAAIIDRRDLIAWAWQARARMMQDLSDEALMAAVSARQQQAFRILMGRHL